MRAVWIGVAVVVVLGAVGAGAVVASGAASGLFAEPEPVPTAFGEVLPDAGFVRVRGLAHYQAILTLDQPASVWQEATTYYTYGLFAPGDLSSREIRLLVRTTEPPPRLTDIEYLEVDGWVREPDRYNLPWRAEEILSSRSDYFFAPDILILEARALRSWDPAEAATPSFRPPEAADTSQD